MPPTKKIHALSHCGHFIFPELKIHLSHSHEVTGAKGVIRLKLQEGECFIFDYGVLIFWDVASNERHSLLTELKDFVITPSVKVLDDDFTYSTQATVAALRNDHIDLPVDSALTRLAVSHGIAQSTKLSQYEYAIQNTINSTAYIPENIASTGRSGLRRKELAKLRGLLFLDKSNINLHFDLLDIPEFFWENPELQSYYTMISEYLEIKPRIELLSKKLETIQDLLQMIADELNHHHSSFLEWIIIWLIAIEIILVVVEQYLR